MGQEEADLAELTEADICPPLKTIQARKIVNKFKSGTSKTRFIFIKNAFK